MSELSVEQQVAVAEQLQAQLGALEQQHEGLQGLLAELRRTKKAIEDLTAAAPDDPVLVPLGSGAFVAATLPKVDKVLAPLGSGLLAEETPGAALARLEAREAEAKNAVDQVAANMTRLEEQLGSLVSALQASGALGGS